MSGEPRRSGRATKGQHTKNLDVTDGPAPKRPKKNKAAKATSAEPSPSDDAGGEAIIRCMCGANEEDEDDERMMIQCDQCEAWQHNECMEISEDEDKLPDKYWCEECRPEDHKELLAKVERGERPWEERAAQRAREEEERKARRRKGNKKGKGGRPGRESLKADTTEDEILEKDTPAQHRHANGTAQQIDASSTDSGTHAANTKRKTRSDEDDAQTLEKDNEPKPKIRRISAHSGEPDGPDNVPVVDMVSSIDELQNQSRKNSAKALIDLFGKLIAQAQKEGTYTLPENETQEGVANRLGLQIEHAVLVNHSNDHEEPNDAYRTRLRSSMFNLRKNSALRDRVLQGLLSVDDFSTMSTDDMASKELQERTAEMKKEAEKQHMLIQEEGPRIRRTHKGEELVGDDRELGGANVSIFSSAPTRRRESAADDDARGNLSPSLTSPVSPKAIELPEDVTSRSPEPAHTATKHSVDESDVTPSTAPSDRRGSTAFNIQNVWSHVHSPDIDKPRPFRKPSGPQPVVTEMSPGASVADPEIDKLLKDEDAESPPYSPTDYPSDPDVVWRGMVSMASVAEFRGTAKHVGGADLSKTIPWSELVPSSLHVDGRIQIERAGDYLCGLRWSHSTDVVVIAIEASTDPVNEAEFDRLYNYFQERSRYGVVGKNPNSAVKDTYIIPVEAGTAKLPDFVEILEHCTIQTPRTERMLLATFVVRSNNTPSAQGTPQIHETTGVSGSPIVHGGVNYSSQTPGGAAQPASYISPVTGYSGGPITNSGHSSQAIPYGISPGHLPPAQHVQQPYQQPPAPSPLLLQTLGALVETPVVQQYIVPLSSLSAPELEIVKDILNQVPAARNDSNVLFSTLQSRSNPNGGK